MFSQRCAVSCRDSGSRDLFHEFHSLSVGENKRCMRFPVHIRPCLSTQPQIMHDISLLHILSCCQCVSISTQMFHNVLGDVLLDVHNIENMTYRQLVPIRQSEKQRLSLHAEYANWVVLSGSPSSSPKILPQSCPAQLVFYRNFRGLSP
jgi:hypothetical protein